MTACSKHSKSPAKGYSQCAGCEVESLQSRLDAAERNVKHWQGLAVTNRNVADAALAKLAERDAVLSSAKPAKGGDGEER